MVYASCSSTASSNSKNTENVKQTLQRLSYFSNKPIEQLPNCVECICREIILCCSGMLVTRDVDTVNEILIIFLLSLHCTFFRLHRSLARWWFCLNFYLNCNHLDAFVDRTKSNDSQDNQFCSALFLLQWVACDSDVKHDGFLAVKQCNCVEQFHRGRLDRFSFRRLFYSSSAATENSMIMVTSDNNLRSFIIRGKTILSHSKDTYIRKEVTKLFQIKINDFLSRARSRFHRKTTFQLWVFWVDFEATLQSWKN